MINHVVLFKLNNYSQEEKKKLEMELKNRLEQLKEVIKEVRKIEVGLSCKPDTGSYDVALFSHFDSPEDLDRYRVHPEHLKVVEFIRNITQARASVDFEF